MHNTGYFPECYPFSVTNGSMWIPYLAKYSEIFNKPNFQVLLFKFFWVRISEFCYLFYCCLKVFFGCWMRCRFFASSPWSRSPVFFPRLLVPSFGCHFSWHRTRVSAFPGRRDPEYRGFTRQFPCDLRSDNEFIVEDSCSRLIYVSSHILGFATKTSKIRTVWQKPRIVTQFQSETLWHFEISQNVAKCHKISHAFKFLVQNYVYHLRLDFAWNASEAHLAIEKFVDWKKLKILVQNQSFWNIVGARHTSQQRER